MAVYISNRASPLVLWNQICPYIAVSRLYRTLYVYVCTALGCVTSKTHFRQAKDGRKQLLGFALPLSRSNTTYGGSILCTPGVSLSWYSKQALKNAASVSTARSSTDGVFCCLASSCLFRLLSPHPLPPPPPYPFYHIFFLLNRYPPSPPPPPLTLSTTLYPSQKPQRPNVC